MVVQLDDDDDALTGKGCSQSKWGKIQLGDFYCSPFGGFTGFSFRARLGGALLAGAASLELAQDESIRWTKLNFFCARTRRQPLAAHWPKSLAV